MQFDREHLRAVASEVCRGKATVEQKRFVVAFYRKVFKKPFTSCNCQLCDAIFLILKNINRMEAKFKLKKGIVLRQHGKVYRITHQNLTDELAVKHLKNNPQDAKYFDYIPPEALKVIKGEQPSKEKPEEKPEAEPQAPEHKEPEIQEAAPKPKKRRKKR